MKFKFLITLVASLATMLLPSYGQNRPLMARAESIYVLVSGSPEASINGTYGPPVGASGVGQKLYKDASSSEAYFEYDATGGWYLKADVGTGEDVQYIAGDGPHEELVGRFIADGDITDPDGVLVQVTRNSISIPSFWRQSTESNSAAVIFSAPTPADPDIIDILFYTAYEYTSQDPGAALVQFGGANLDTVFLGGCTSLVTDEVITIFGASGERTSVVTGTGEPFVVDPGYHRLTLIWSESASAYAIELDGLDLPVVAGGGGHATKISATEIRLGANSGGVPTVASIYGLSLYEFNGSEADEYANYRARVTFPKFEEDSDEPNEAAWVNVSMLDENGDYPDPYPTTEPFPNPTANSTTGNVQGTTNHITAMISWPEDIGGQTTCSEYRLQISLLAGAGDILLTKGPVEFENVNDRVLKFLHGFVEGDKIEFNGVNLPPEIASATAYYVRNPTESTFQLSLSPVGDIVDFTEIDKDGIVSRRKDGVIWDSFTAGDGGSEWKILNRANHNGESLPFSIQKVGTYFAQVTGYHTNAGSGGEWLSEAKKSDWRMFTIVDIHTSLEPVRCLLESEYEFANGGVVVTDSWTNASSKLEDQDWIQIEKYHAEGTVPEYWEEWEPWASIATSGGKTGLPVSTTKMGWSLVPRFPNNLDKILKDGLSISGQKAQFRIRDRRGEKAVEVTTFRRPGMNWKWYLPWNAHLQYEPHEWVGPGGPAIHVEGYSDWYHQGLNFFQSAADFNGE